MIKKKQSLAPLKAQVSKVVSSAEMVVIKTQEDMAQAVDILGQIKTIGKKITEQKEKITKPLAEALKNARLLFKPLEEQWEEAEKTIKYKMVKYQTLTEAKAAEKIEKIEEKIESGEISFEQGIKKIDGLEPEQSIATEDFSLKFREDKKMVITDASLVPDEFWIIDEVKLRRDVLSGKEVPGTKIEIIKTPVSGRVK